MPLPPQPARRKTSAQGATARPLNELRRGMQHPY
jgi:hypothetical protein